jgi:hypothetical protein
MVYGVWGMGYGAWCMGTCGYGAYVSIALTYGVDYYTSTPSHCYGSSTYNSALKCLQHTPYNTHYTHQTTRITSPVQHHRDLSVGVLRRLFVR